MAKMTIDDEWAGLLRRALDDEIEIDASFVNLVTHVPMRARLRNELINRGYATMANHLARMLYPDGVTARSAPNFFCFAHWASCYVGQRMETRRGRFISEHLVDGNAVVFQSMARAFMIFERRVRYGESVTEATVAINRLVPAAPRMNTNVDALVNLGSRERPASLTDPARGLPPRLLASVDPTGTAGAATMLQTIRERGFEAYWQARQATSDAERRSLILEGTAWLVISEQSLVDPAVTLAVRTLARNATAPWTAFTTSRRSRELGDVRETRGRAEEAWVRTISRSIECALPPGVLDGVAPLWFRPAGPASVAGWIRDGAGDSLPACAPFCWFELPDFDQQPLRWTALSHRLPVIMSILHASHDAHWFERGELRQAPRWSGFDLAAQTDLDTDQRSVTPPVIRPRVNTQRLDDWRTAHRLFTRDRELVFAALFTRSLPASYACAHGAALLDRGLHNLAQPRSTPGATMADDSLLRLRTTADFVHAMFMSPLPPGAPHDDARYDGRTKREWLERVAHVHSRVRRHVTRAATVHSHAVPDPALFDDPLGYEQMVGAGISFVSPVVEVLDEHFGQRWTTAERDSWARVWFEITLAQGLDDVLAKDDVDDYLGLRRRPVSELRYADVVAAADEIRQRSQRRSLSGVRLADKLVRDLEDAVPTFARPLIRLGLTVFGDDEVNRLLRVPRTHGDRSTAVVSRMARPLVATLTRRFVQTVLREIASAEARPTWDEVFVPGLTAASTVPRRGQRRCGTRPSHRRSLPLRPSSEPLARTRAGARGVALASSAWPQSR